MYLIDQMLIKFAVGYLKETAQKLSVAVGRIDREIGKPETSKMWSQKKPNRTLFQPMKMNTLNFQFNLIKLPPADGKKFT